MTFHLALGLSLALVWAAQPAPIDEPRTPLAVLSHSTALELRHAVAAPCIALYEDGTVLAFEDASAANAPPVSGGAQAASAPCARGRVDSETMDRLNVLARTVARQIAPGGCDGGRGWYALDEVESTLALGLDATTRTWRVRSDLRFDPDARARAPAAYLALHDALSELATQAREPWSPEFAELVLVPAPLADALALARPALGGLVPTARDASPEWPAAWPIPLPRASADRADGSARTDLAARVDGAAWARWTAQHGGKRRVRRVRFAEQEWVVLPRWSLPDEGGPTSSSPSARPVRSHAPTRS